MEASALQFSNVPPRISRRPDGRVTELRLVQPAKASHSISVTVFGMVTDFRPVQPSKALQPISFRLDGKVTALRAVHL